eukprot:2479024-Pyramimonas_sp.AAC.1
MQTRFPLIPTFTNPALRAGSWGRLNPQLLEPPCVQAPGAPALRAGSWVCQTRKTPRKETGPTSPAISHFTRLQALGPPKQHPSGDCGKKSAWTLRPNPTSMRPRRSGQYALSTREPISFSTERMRNLGHHTCNSYARSLGASKLLERA